MFSIVSPKVARLFSHVQITHFKSSRTVFTRDFLGLSLFSSKQQVFLQDLTAKNIEVKKLRLDLQSMLNSQTQIVDPKLDHAPITVLSDDVMKMIYTSKTLAEIHETKNFIRTFIMQSDTDNPIIQRKCSFLWRGFISLCHESNLLEPAEDLWKDEEFKNKMGYIDFEKRTMGFNMPAIAETYLDLLYRFARYKDVIHEVEYLKANILDVPIFLMSAAMMSCLKMNTRESSAIAISLIKGDGVEKLINFPYVAHPYALLACLQNNYGLAYEALSGISKNSMLRAGLLVHVLCKLDRVSDAMEVLEGVLKTHDQEDEPAAPPKLYFSIETITTLTDAVEKTKDRSFKIRLASLFKRLDKVAEIDQRSLYDVVTADIEETNFQRNRRQKNLVRLSKKRSEIGNDDFEIESENQNLI